MKKLFALVLSLVLLLTATNILATAEFAWQGDEMSYFRRWSAETKPTRTRWFLTWDSLYMNIAPDRRAVVRICTLGANNSWVTASE